MFKILIAIKGILNDNTYKCALTFKDITFSENYEVDIVFLAWRELKTIKEAVTFKNEHLLNLDLVDSSLDPFRSPLLLKITPLFFLNNEKKHIYKKF